VNTLQSGQVTGLSGLITVRTESWNSKDGLVVRSHKTHALGGLRHTLDCVTIADKGDGGNIALRPSPEY